MTAVAQWCASLQPGLFARSIMQKESLHETRITTTTACY